MQRVKYISHRGKQILLHDLSACEPADLIASLETGKRLIEGTPFGSVLTLVDVSNTRYNREVAAAIKGYAAANKPYVRASAIVGLDGIKEVLLNAVILLTRRKFSVFDDVESAKDWLATN